MESIRATLPAELESVLVGDFGEKKFRVSQILKWVFERRAESWDDMTNLSKSLRDRLSHYYALPPLPEPEQHVAKDGTNKLACRLSDGSIVESVLIPTEDRLT